MSLDDAFQRLEMGKEHVAHLFAHLMLTFEKDQFRVEIRSKPIKKPSSFSSQGTWEALTVLCTHVPNIEKREEILLGEAVQSFRSSLDYLAWTWTNESTLLHGMRLTASQERQIQFPMAHNTENFRSKLNNWLPGVSRSRRAFIEQFQPYKRSQAGVAMRYLQTLSNIDKHRLIVPAMMSPQVGDIQFKWHKSLSLVKKIYHLNAERPIEDGTKIMNVVLAGSAPVNHPKVHVDSKITMMPMFPKNILEIEKL